MHFDQHMKTEQTNQCQEFCSSFCDRRDYVVPFMKYGNSFLGRAEMPLDNGRKDQFETFITVL